MLLRGSLDFCFCITWFLGLDNLVGINRAGLYKEPKVLQVHAQLAQKGECWTWGERRSEVQVQLSLRVTCCYWSFCFHVVKPLMPTLASLPMLCLCEDPDYNKEPTVIWRHRKASYSLQSHLTGSSRIQLIHLNKWIQYKIERNTNAFRNYIQFVDMALHVFGFMLQWPSIEFFSFSVKSNLSN